MRKKIIVISVLAVIILISSILAGCKVVSALDPLKELNTAFENTVEVKAAKIQIEVKAGSVTVYSEITEYRVESDQVNYSSTVKKPSSDIWQKDDYSESVSSGSMQKSDFSKVLPTKQAINENDVDGEIKKSEVDGRAVYEFTLSNAEKLAGEGAKNTPAEVEIQTENEKITYIKIKYSENGYEVEKIYEIDN